MWLLMNFYYLQKLDRNVYTDEIANDEIIKLKLTNKNKIFLKGKPLSNIQGRL